VDGRRDRHRSSGLRVYITRTTVLPFYGTNVNMQGEGENNALYAAASYPYPNQPMENTRVFIEHGADNNLVGG
jgi:hypothetical protein